MKKRMIITLTVGIMLTASTGIPALVKGDSGEEMKVLNDAVKLLQDWEEKLEKEGANKQEIIDIVKKMELCREGLTKQAERIQNTDENIITKMYDVSAELQAEIAWLKHVLTEFSSVNKSIDAKPASAYDTRVNPNRGWEDEWKRNSLCITKHYYDTGSDQAGSYSFSSSATNGWAYTSLYWKSGIVTALPWDITFHGDIKGNLFGFLGWPGGFVHAYDKAYWYVHDIYNGEIIKEEMFHYEFIEFSKKIGEWIEYPDITYDESYSFHGDDRIEQYNLGVKLRAYSSAWGVYANCHSNFGHEETSDYYWTLDWIDL